jgi:RNA polymerase sigma-70 factor (ECF subfamily)
MDLERELTAQRNARFEALLNPIYTDVQRWSMHKAQNQADAEDLLASSLLTALKNLHQLKNDGAFKTWMFRIISNTWKMKIRSRRPEDPMDPTEMPVVAASTVGGAERTERARIVRTALEKLSSEQRDALVLFEVHGLSTREIAGVLSKQEVAVRVLLHRSRARLAELLKAAGIQE